MDEYDDYLREIVQEEFQSVMADAEIYDDFTDEELENPSRFEERIYRLVWEEFPDYKNEDGLMEQFGWTVRKRRCIREEIQIINDCHLMHSALATSCKRIYNATTNSQQFQFEDRARDWQFALQVFNGIIDKYF